MKESFICPDGVQTGIDECFAKCRMEARCAPLTYLRRVGEVSRVWSGRPSCTQLIRGTRQVWLEYITPWAVSPDDSVWLVTGSAGHAQLENAGRAAGDEVEQWVELDGISGRFDFVEPNDDGPGCLTLVDYKFVGSYAVAKALGLETVTEPMFDAAGEPVMLRSGPRKGQQKTYQRTVRNPEKVDLRDYVAQENFYRLAANDGFLRQAEAELPGLPVKRVTRMKLFMIARDGNTVVAKSRGVTRNMYYFDIPVVEDEKVRAAFGRKKEALLGAFEQNPQAAADRPWPGPCSAYEAWDGNKCRRYCAVARACVMHGDNPWIRPDQLAELQLDDGTPGAE